ncbi:hypothetical protein [Spirosoma panaciterrae]|uniref:hypothetical protein n=1 Tax=Spirosoma panaciterrae TaxID=496058 RepID=UPI0003A2F992|nr:hypothetical protein [Spirosoma panaciterrae]
MVGHPIGFSFVGVVGLADSKFSLDKRRAAHKRTAPSLAKEGLGGFALQRGGCTRFRCRFHGKRLVTENRTVSVPDRLVML